MSQGAQAIRQSIRKKYYNRSASEKNSDGGKKYRRKTGKLWDSFKVGKAVSSGSSGKTTYSVSVYQEVDGSEYRPLGESKAIKITPKGGNKFLTVPNSQVSDSVRISPDECKLHWMVKSPQGKGAKKNIYGAMGDGTTTHWFLMKEVILPRRPKGMASHIAQKSYQVHDRMVGRIIDKFGDRGVSSGARQTTAQRFS
jgi:hypothetical protein